MSKVCSNWWCRTRPTSAPLSDAALVDAAGALARGENALCARKLAVMAELFARRTGLPGDARDQWWLDPQAAVAAELAAAVNVSHGLAVHQTHRGVALRDRLPRVAQLFEAGVVSDLVVRTIVWRTYLITDAAAMAAVDAALAARITRWGAWSAKKTETAIDALVDAHDPAALRRCREAAATPQRAVRVARRRGRHDHHLCPVERPGRGADRTIGRAVRARGV